MHLRKGDQVVVISGKEKGKRGRVLRLLTDQKRVLIERINMVKRHTKPTQRNPRGGIIEKEAPIHLSNVMLYDPKAGKGVRVGVRFTKDGKRERVSRATGDTLSKE